MNIHSWGGECDSHSEITNSLTGFKKICHEYFDNIKESLLDELESYWDDSSYENQTKEKTFENIVSLLWKLGVKNNLEEISDIYELSYDNLELDIDSFFQNIASESQQKDIVWALSFQDLHDAHTVVSEFDFQIKQFLFQSQVKSKLKEIIDEQEDEWFIYDAE